MKYRIHYTIEETGYVDLEADNPTFAKVRVESKYGDDPHFELTTVHGTHIDGPTLVVTDVEDIEES